MRPTCFHGIVSHGVGLVTDGAVTKKAACKAVFVRGTDVGDLLDVPVNDVTLLDAPG